ncbi:ABC transporter permease [Phototrophicus methaneseepsis]|uniref:Xylose transport system permease protein XylH n=1 Tax=Phototrophicus methaneseepsis TaxID=2710758 RepID=A0A7S8ECZ9_9CHLR|nr:ABC transporter permease [Phototrophicus methaneseepsis]QPC84710.1 ABC transporter permease [Phototrophicus methaneseepsis]
MQAFLDGKRDSTRTAQLFAFVMLALAAVGILVAEQIITGWLPLGERANILRSDKNLIEWAAIIVSVIYAIACLRTAWGLWQQQAAAISWTRWMSLLTAIIGFMLIASVLIPAVVKFFLLVAEVNGGDPPPETTAQMNLGVLVAIVGCVLLLLPRNRRFDHYKRTLQLSGLVLLGLGVGWMLVQIIQWVELFPLDVANIRHPELWRLLPGIALFTVGLIIYLLTRPNVEASDDLRRAVSMSPTKTISLQLAKSPSAGAIIGFIAIFFGFTMTTDLFFTQSSIASILTNVSSRGIIAIGITILMISGEFDLSVGSILGVVAMTFMTFMTEGIPGMNTGPLDVIPAAALAMFVAFVLGLINGLILITTGIPSFIVTLGTLLAYRAITLVVIAGGRILRYRDYFSEFPTVDISPWVLILLALIAMAVTLFLAWRSLPNLWRRAAQVWQMRQDNGYFGTTTAIYRAIFAFLATAATAIFAFWLLQIIIYYLSEGQFVQAGWFDLINGRWDLNVHFLGLHIVTESAANFRMAIIWWLIFVFVFNVILMRTPYGNSVFAVGGNEAAARAQGINVARIKVQNFVLTAMLTGIAAIYETARNPGVDPLKGQGWELEVIAMTVIGGALLSGGYGSVFGSFLGALIFGMLQTGLVLVGIDSRLFQGTVGVIIIVAVVLNTTVRGRQK